jgi:hypothetical protein
MIRPSDNKKFTFSSLFLIDENGIKAEGSKLSKEKAQKIQAAILIFTNSVDTKKKLTLTAPLDGIWVPHVEPGVEFRINEDGTATVR